MTANDYDKLEELVGELSDLLKLRKAVKEPERAWKRAVQRAVNEVADYEERD